MNKKLKNMVADIVKEMSGTGTGAGMTPGPNPPIATAKAFKKPKKEIKDVEPKLAAGKVKDNYAVSHFGFTPAPSIPNRKSKAMDYKELWEKEVDINENYAHFRNETSKRNPSEQLHRAVKEIKRKLQEVDKLVEYTGRLRSEISEGEGNVKYNTHTERALESITEMIKQTYIKTKKLK